MTGLPFRDRIEGAQALADALADYAGRTDLLVLGLPRGGVPVAAEVAKRLGAPLDLVIVRKLGAPGQEELAVGAIASGGGQVLNEALVRLLHLSEAALESIADREREELRRREQAYRGERPAPGMKDRCLLLVDDGLATGATMRAAVQAVRQAGPSRVVVAIPVAPPDTVAVLRREADEVVCVAMPEPFMSVGQWYLDFSQVSDQQVVEILRQAWAEQEAS
jgi:putative phosphoribosyl transferase